MAGLVLNKLRIFHLPQTGFVGSTCAAIQQVRHIRYSKKFVKIRNFQKWKKQRDADKGWAAPLLEYQKQIEEGIPEIEPSPLHAVSRIRPTKGIPWWDKKTLERLGLLNTKLNQWTVHKNTPKVNADLQKVSYLLKILPVTFPNGLPEDPSDFDHAWLKSNGEFVVNKTLQPVHTQVLGSEAYQERTRWEMDSETVKREMRRKLERSEMHEEYYPTIYEYEHNQDGKQSRYDGWIKTEKEKEEKKRTIPSVAIPRPGVNT